MKYLKHFSESNKISELCEQFEIKNWSIENGLVNVDDDVDLSSKNLDIIPIRFGHVTGMFDCDNNNLTDLINAPEICGSDVFAWHNNISNLSNSPKVIDGSLHLGSNPLKNLNNITENITDELTFSDCSDLYDIKKLPVCSRYSFNKTPYHHLWVNIKNLENLSLFYDMRVVVNKDLYSDRYENYLKLTRDWYFFSLLNIKKYRNII